MLSWQGQERETQARSRERNEWRARGAGDAARQLGCFRCECGDASCRCTIRLTAAEYESVRAYATHFVIARNHENPECQQVLEEQERFAVVETISGEATKHARVHNPRQRLAHSAVDRPESVQR